MSYEIEYDLSNTKEAEDKAIDDCKEWLTLRRFNKVVKALQQDEGRTSKNRLILYLGLLGIQGYPAHVMIRRYWNPQQSLFN